MTQTPPQLIIHINFWTLLQEVELTSEDSLRKHLSLIREAGFQGYCAPPDTPRLKELLEEYGLKFGGAFTAGNEREIQEQIAAHIAVGNGPMNCQLGAHDTPLERAIELTVFLMEEAARQNAQVHVEVHRNTCTETPEKMAAVMEGYKKIKGEYPLMNFDYSHPAIVKHLDASNYSERLFTNIPAFQQSTLWHIRPFNGHHCQIPITNGKSGWSPEYEDMRPFIRQALTHWLNGPRPGNTFWVMPEQGTGGYHLSCCPRVWDDAVALGKDVQQMWTELTTDTRPMG